VKAATKKRKPRMGRPPKPEGTARTGVFAFKLSEEERAAIVAAAERAGKPVTQWARETLLTSGLLYPRATG
jgi:transposase-like protein